VANTILVTFQMIMAFQQTFIHSHIYVCLNEKPHSDFFWWNHMNGILHIELTWDNELICNIWLSTSSSLIIVWMVLEVYLHFAIYCDDYKIFTNILFNHLISISKWDFFLQSYSLGFELHYSKYHLQKNNLIWTW
jgi:hypothetical protein